MNEPTIEIPARIALLASKHLHHIAKFVIPMHAEVLNDLSDQLSDAVAGQLSKSELDQALISAKIQESTNRSVP